MKLIFYYVGQIQSQGDPANFVATPILEKAAQSTPSAVPNEPQQSPVSLASLGILLVIVLLIIVIIFALMMYSSSQRRNRDKKRKEDLRRLAQAFEAYRQEHGQYPLSSTYLPQYYTGVNLSKDWNYYGLPDKEHMVRYLPDWPISDPSIDYNAQNQVNQYIYYPKENGQKFFLYAHLEAPSKAEQVDYNQQDNLLRAWGAYNYRVASGQEQPSTVQQIPHPQHAKPTAPASSTPTPQQSQPAPVANDTTAPTPSPATSPQPQVAPSVSAPQVAPVPVAPAQSQAAPGAPVSPPIQHDTNVATPLSPTPAIATPAVPTPIPTTPPSPQPGLVTPRNINVIQPSSVIYQQPQSTPAPEPEPLMPSAPESQFTSSEPVITAMPPTDQPAATNPESPVIDPNTDNNQPV